MKTTIKILSILFLTTVIFYSCNDEDLDVTDNSAGFSTGGLIRNDSKLVNFVIGSDAVYNFNLRVYQGEIKTTSVDIMKSFTKASGETSNEVLLKNVPVTSDKDSNISFSTNFEELIQGLEIDGQPLPTVDSEFAIADYWTFRYVSNTNEGKSHSNGEVSKVAVSTRLAGIYTVTESSYMHPTAGNQGNFNGVTRIIESVANTPEKATYLCTDIGGWVDDRNFFYFYVSNTPEADGSFKLTIPKEYNGETQLIWGADEIAICQNNEVSGMPCDNYAIISDDGHDVISMSYGYIRDSGTRKFYEVDVKN